MDEKRCKYCDAIDNSPAKYRLVTPTDSIEVCMFHFEFNLSYYVLNSKTVTFFEDKTLEDIRTFIVSTTN